MQPLRKIVHIDMDAFYASVEQRDDPALAGRPVVVAWRGARSVVCAASYEARRFGVRSAMPALTAERLCPNAVFVAPDFSRYKAVSRQIRAIFARHSELVEPLSLDEAFLDATEPLSGLASATAVAEAIRAEIRGQTGLTASAGVAPNKFLAKIASDWNKPDGIKVIRPHEVAAFLAPLPVGAIPGVGKVMQRRLAALGIDTVGALRGEPPERLEQLFGRWGARLAGYAQGIDERPVSANRINVQVSAETTFERDIPLSALEPHIRELAAKVWHSQRKDSERVARTAVLKLKTSDFRNLTRSLTTAHGPASAADLATTACDLRQRIELPAGTLYRLVGVGLSGFVDRDLAEAQADLFQRA